MGKHSSWQPQLSLQLTVSFNASYGRQLLWRSTDGSHPRILAWANLRALQLYQVDLHMNGDNLLFETLNFGVDYFASSDDQNISSAQ